MSDAAWREQWRSEGGELPKMERCPHCYIEMPALADKCLKCSSNRRFRFSITSGMTAFVSVLVALISVAVTAIPVLKPFMFPRNSDPRVAFLGANPDQTVEFNMVNVGRDTAVLSTGAIYIRNRGGENLKIDVTFPKSINKDDFRTLRTEEIRTFSGRLEYPKNLLVGTFSRIIHEKDTECRGSLHFIGLIEDRAANFRFDCIALEPLTPPQGLPASSKGS